MRQICDLNAALPLFKCLGSDIRAAILTLLSTRGPMSMTELSSELGISAGSLSPHIRMLSECSLLTVEQLPGKHGTLRMCSLAEDRLIIDLTSPEGAHPVYESEVGVGQYTDYAVLPTCGLATCEHVIGAVDDTRYFASPERFNAGILWFSQGYVEYIIPNFLEREQQAVELLLSFEIASEAPGTREDWPSDLRFSINGIPLCQWTSPGDYGETRGIYAPDWWDSAWNQYGLLKFLSVDDAGTYIDGVRRSGISLQDLNLQPGTIIRFRIDAPGKGEHNGGLTLFGRGFGNYDQGIQVRMRYRQSTGR